MSFCRRDQFFLDLPGPGLVYPALSVLLYTLGASLPWYAGTPFVYASYAFGLFWLVGTISNNILLQAYPTRLEIWAGRAIFAGCVSAVLIVATSQWTWPILRGLAIFTPAWGLSWLTGGYMGTKVRLLYRRQEMLAREEWARMDAARKAAESRPEEVVPPPSPPTQAS